MRVCTTTSIPTSPTSINEERQRNDVKLLTLEITQSSWVQNKIFKFNKQRRVYLLSIASKSVLSSWMISSEHCHRNQLPSRWTAGSAGLPFSHILKSSRQICNRRTQCGQFCALACVQPRLTPDWHQSSDTTRTRVPEQRSGSFFLHSGRFSLSVPKRCFCAATDVAMFGIASSAPVPFLGTPTIASWETSVPRPFVGSHSCWLAFYF